MTKPRNVLLLAGALLSVGLVWWQGTGKVAAGRAGPPASPVSAGAAASGGEEARPANSLTAAVAPEFAPAPTRRETVEAVLALYRKEQLTRELDLEQLRYGRHPWQTEPNGRALAAVQQARDALLKELGAEANQVLNRLFPAEAGEAIILAAIFDEEHPGPNLTFLSPSSRAQFEAGILADDDERGVERARLMDLAARVLPADEMEAYRQWNEPAAAALRDQLVGFNQTEGEFAALLRQARLAREEPDGPGEAAGLEAQLGPARFAEFTRLQDPALQTALRDLQRLGLPLADADWLAATRTRAIADIGEIWRSPALTDTLKHERVTQVERVYGQAIAAELALPAGTLDGLNPGS